jgi:hypothetical protein
MNREEYEKDKAAKIAAKKRIIDLVQPKSELPSMFREEVSVYEITKDSIWNDAKGATVAFGGVYNSNTRERENRTIMLTPTFMQLVATGAGVSACGEPIIEKIKSRFEIILPSGRKIMQPYTSRVVGKIAFQRLTPSGSPEKKFYTTEVDIDMALGAAILDDIEKIGTEDKYKKRDGKPLVYTEDDIKYSTGSDSKDSIARFDKLRELEAHAYQKVDTKLRSHGVEKFIGIPNISENMLGSFVYVSRISYNPDDPRIAKALAFGAVRDLLGIQAPKNLTDEVAGDSFDSDAVDATDVTEEPLDGVPGDTTSDEAPAVDVSTKRSAESLFEIESWLQAGSIKDVSVAEYLKKIISCDVSEEVLDIALRGTRTIAKSELGEAAAEDGFKDILRSIQKTPAFMANEKASAAIDSLINNFSHPTFVSYIGQAIKKLDGK